MTPDTPMGTAGTTADTSSTDTAQAAVDPTQAPAPTPVDPAPAPVPTDVELTNRVGTLETTTSSLTTRVSSLENRAAPAAAAGGAEVVSYEDYDYVTETTTVRYGVVLEHGVQVDAEGETEPTLTVGWLHGEATLPAAAFEQH